MTGLAFSVLRQTSGRFEREPLAKSDDWPRSSVASSKFIALRREAHYSFRHENSLCFSRAQTPAHGAGAEQRRAVGPPGNVPAGDRPS